jgi:uncharacterized BrkB/YihY/UPF0761 family membrane protein
MTTRTGVERGRIRRTLTFWLRPAFVLRVINRFQRVVGFDRAIALASSALTALVPLAVVAGAILPRVDTKDAADAIVSRYGLTGGGAKAVEDVLAPATGANVDVSVLGVLLLLVAVMSFSRGMQRLFEQTWDLKPLSVRNSANDLVWIAGLVCYIVFSWWIRGLLDGGRVQLAATLLLIPVSAIFLTWTGRVLSGRRIGWRRLVAFGLVGAGLLALCAIGGAVYVPHLFSSYASRFGVIGAVLAMISALFTVMVAVVASAAMGREVSEELERIARGERPPPDEVRREWQAVVDQTRSRWVTVRARIDRFHRRERQRD